MADDANLPAYFERIGFSGSIAPTLKTLEALCALHPAAVPFENIDLLMGSAIRLEPNNIQQKLIFEKRGGYCFEQNLFFRRALETLDYKVRPIAATVLWGEPEPGPDEERPATHLALLVDIAGTNYLCDVGFGGVTLSAPLKLKSDAVQQTPHEPFRLTNADGVWTLEVEIGAEWRKVYRFTTEEITFEDIEAMNDRVERLPRFREALMVARAEKGRRLSLANNRLTTHVVGENRQVRVISSLEDLKTVLAETFGIALPPAERLDPALARFFPQPSAAAEPEAVAEAEAAGAEDTSAAPEPVTGAVDAQQQSQQ
ncbi:N-hydroxyarylamine O-acetyltransferase [Devosia enhydra]|uniref:N-hydroxyarylamine O-acetyltransferase n=1 Tax=Devosia enhydra TaxID=665118 RepID=A0A1K2HXA6_9HYPH|nr:arylamine N-acetyltransferase [Devosia enhydra]SFZ84249.1 N-hydroxyarylamine O-acetyltransferase [Devosia enhydra]